MTLVVTPRSTLPRVPSSAASAASLCLRQQGSFIVVSGDTAHLLGSDASLRGGLGLQQVNTG